MSSGDILVSFDVISLFSMLPIKDTLQFISSPVPSDITELFDTASLPRKFHWNRDFYEQVDATNFFIDVFELEDLNTVPKKPKC